MSDINFIINRLDEVLNDKSTPRNIKRAVDAAKKALLDESREESVRAAVAISEIEKIIDDPNMPFYIRTVLWEIVSSLENIANKEK